MENIKHVTESDNVRLSEDGKSVVIIDQTKLPNVTEYLTLQTAEDLYEAIQKLRVRGLRRSGYLRDMEYTVWRRLFTRKTMKHSERNFTSIRSI